MFSFFLLFKKNKTKTKKVALPNKYFLLTKFDGRIVSYGPIIPPIDLWSARFALGS